MIALALILATVTGNPPPTSYTCNGTSTSYVIPWPYLAASHVSVVVKGVGAGTLAQTADYTVTPSTGTSTGTLKLVAASRCQNGATLTISRVVPLTQPTSFRTGAYQGAAHEQAFDRSMMVAQQNAAQILALQTVAANATTTGLLSAADWVRFNTIATAPGSIVSSINGIAGINDPSAVLTVLENGRVSQLPYIEPFAQFRMDTFTGAWAVAALLGEKQEATAFTRTTVGELIVGGVATSAAAGILRFQDNPQGLLIEPSRINQIGAPDAPVSETGMSLPIVSTYYLRIEGTGSMTVTLATGTATGLPLTVTAATPGTFAITAAATVNTTVSGSVTFAQMETGKFPTSRIHTHSPSRGSDQLLAAGLLRNGRDWIVTVKAQPNGGFPWGPGDDRGLFTIGENFTTANTSTAYVTGGNGGIQFQVADSTNANRSISAITFLGAVEHDFWFYGSADGVIEAWVDGERVVGAPSGAGTGFISTMPANLRAGTAFNGSFLNGVVKDFRIYYDTTPARLPKPQWTKTITPQTVACLGDSITFGTGSTTSTYPATLQTTLSAGTTGAWTVLNAGVFGDHAYETIRRWGSGIRRQTHKYVVVLSGTNDISIGLSATTVWSYLTRTLTQIRTDGKTAVLITILPRNSFSVAQNAERVKLNGLIRAYAATGGAILVDADPVFDNGDGTTLKVAFSSDGTHPNQAGHDALAALVAAAIPH